MFPVVENRHNMSQVDNVMPRDGVGECGGDSILGCGSGGGGSGSNGDGGSGLVVSLL